MKQFIPLLAALGGLLLGYDTGIIGTSIIHIQSELSLSPILQGLTASLIIIGIMFGSFLSHVLNQKWERRNILVIGTIVYACGYGFIILSTTVALLWLGRLVAGMGIGILLVTVPLYLAEIAPPARRGMFIATFQLAITFGIVLGYLFCYVFSSLPWRVLFIFGLVWASLLLISRMMLPAQQFAEQTSQNTNKFSFNYLSVYVIGIGICMIQQITGINAIMYFAPQIFSDLSSHNASVPIFSSLIIAAANFIFTILSLFILDTLGRRPVLLISLALQFFALALLGYFSYAEFSNSLFIAALIIYIFAYAVGLGPTGWLIISEIYPYAIRTKAMAITLIVNNIMAFAVTSSFLPLLELLGKANLFIIYSLIALCSFGFVWYVLPETKRESLSEIENKFKY